MASGDSLHIFTALHHEPRASQYAKPDLRNQHPVLDFTAAALNKGAVFSAVMSRSYDGGGITAYLHYAMSSAEVGSVDWDVSFERIGNGILDIDADSFAAVKSADDNVVPGTSGLVDVVSIAFADGAEIDGILVGEGFRIKVVRDAASDDAAGDAELLFVELKET